MSEVYVTDANKHEKGLNPKPKGADSHNISYHLGNRDKRRRLMKRKPMATPRALNNPEGVMTAGGGRVRISQRKRAKFAVMRLLWKLRTLPRRTACALIGHRKTGVFCMRCYQVIPTSNVSPAA